MRSGASVYVAQGFSGTYFSVFLREREEEGSPWRPTRSWEWYYPNTEVEDAGQWLKDRLIEVLERL